MAEIVSGILIGLIMALIVLTILGWTLWYRKKDHIYTRNQLDEIVDERLEQSRSTIKGHIGEQIAPHMQEFIEKYDPADARFLGGKPVDYIVYKNYSNAAMDKESRIEEVVFVEIKTGKQCGLLPVERKIKEASVRSSTL